MPQHRNCLAAHGRWPPTGLWQWSCVYFVTAWSVWSFWHNRPQHPNQKVTYHFWLFWKGTGLVHLLSNFSLLFLLVTNQLHPFWNVNHRVQFWDLSYLLCIHSLSAISFVNQTTHTISLQMIPSSTSPASPQTLQLLSIVWKTVLKMSLSGWVPVCQRWIMIKLRSLPLVTSLR